MFRHTHTQPKPPTASAVEHGQAEKLQSRTDAWCIRPQPMNPCALWVSPKKMHSVDEKDRNTSQISWCWFWDVTIAFFSLNKLPCGNFKQSSDLAPRPGNLERHVFELRQIITEPGNFSFCYQRFVAASAKARGPWEDHERTIIPWLRLLHTNQGLWRPHPTRGTKHCQVQQVWRPR